MKKISDARKMSMPPIHEPKRLAELEEVVGKLRSIETIDIGQVAHIGKFCVLLPENEDLIGKLQCLVGRRMAMLRLDGFHVRCLDTVIGCEVNNHVGGDRNV